ncbi:hypothetical protein HMPREF3213_01133 [Heyndrickxia coagulans]|uniref:Uncharacterized protein n=1 Tax=Heyndrickxia coagulans TaxID=1398 RepID=A0A133KWS7_HEYCO|nr:hypothetical protein HMPREF3213_01133 [Heyndrickxia coagulans]
MSSLNLNKFRQGQKNYGKKRKTCRILRSNVEYFRMKRKTANE